MTKSAKTSVFKPTAPRSETLMDKISRAAGQIIDDETEQRALKTARLRKARLEREAHTPPVPAPKAKSGAKSGATRKKAGPAPAGAPADPAQP